MNYFLLKLKFCTPLHIGENIPANSLSSSKMTICADTIFSALCHTILEVEGTKGIQQLYQYAVDNKFCISDAFPYSPEDYFLPKPMITSRIQQDTRVENRKIYKKLNFIPLKMFSSYMSFIKGEGDFEVEKAIYTFGESYVQDKVAIRGVEESQPYSVGVFHFEKNHGLYILIGYEEDDIAKKMIRLFQLLGAGGIGGKVSSGYGKFHIEDTIYLEDSKEQELCYLREMLTKKSNNYILLTSSLPKEYEMESIMEECSYTLIRRGGFAFSTSYVSPLKKQTQYFFASGSVFSTTYHGDVYDVSRDRDRGHPVYRYSKPMFLGVNL